MIDVHCPQVRRTIASAAFVMHHYAVTPNSPAPRRLRAPRWFDLRVLLGVMLVLCSVLLGAVLLTRASAAQPYLAATHDLAAGTTISDSDVRVTRIRLPHAAERYFAAGQLPNGQALAAPIRAGELVPRSAVQTASAGTTVTIPVRPENAPDLQRGQRITVWVSTRFCQAAVVIADVPVQQVRDGSKGALTADAAVSVVVRLSPELAARVVSAVGLPDVVIRIGVVSGRADDHANDALPDLAGCQAPSSEST